MRIAELELETHCLEEMFEFYAQTLGFEILHRDSQAFVIHAGYTQLTFKEMSGETMPFYHFAFNVPSNLLPNSMDWLGQRGIPFLCAEDGDPLIEQGPHWNAHSCYFHDPAGNIAEFIGRRALPDSPATEFMIDKILGVSEIGLPVAEVVNVVEEISLHCALTRVHDDSGPNFVGIGNDEGLLIVVNDERPWFPTGEAPVISPIYVKIQTGENGIWRYREGVYRVDSF